MATRPNDEMGTSTLMVTSQRRGDDGSFSRQSSRHTIVMISWQTGRRLSESPLVKGMAEKKSVKMMREPTLDPYRVMSENTT